VYKENPRRENRRRAAAAMGGGTTRGITERDLKGGQERGERRPRTYSVTERNVCQAVARGILRNVGCDITAKYSFALSLSLSPSFLRLAARACTAYTRIGQRDAREGVLKTARVWSDITRTPESFARSVPIANGKY